MRDKVKSLLAVLLCASLLLGIPLTAFAASVGGSGSISSKEEVVYAMLDAGGAVEELYVVNILNISKAGTVTDYGDYDSVRNLTDTSPLESKDGQTAITGDTGRFYYQGNVSGMELPWLVQVTYTLDGKTISPQELAGKTGNLELHIGTERNPKADASFYDNYMLQVSVTLDSTSCTNIQGEGGTFANSGTDKLITFTVMPGSDADITVTAVVKNMEMSGISFSAVPFSIDIDIGDISEMTEGLTELADAIGQLNEGVGKLAGGTGDLTDGVGEIQKAMQAMGTGMGSLSSSADELAAGVKELGGGVKELSTGMNALTEGSAAFQGGLTALTGGAGELSEGSAAIYQGLQAITGGLSGSGGDGGDLDLSSLTALPGALSAMADGLSEVAGGLGVLAEGFGQGLSALEGAVNAIPDGGVPQESIAALYTLAGEDAGLQATIGQLVAGYTAAQTVKGTYAAAAPAFTAVQSGLPAMQGLISTIAESLRYTAGQIQAALSDLDIFQSLQQLTEGLGALTANYGTFHQGLTAYLDGVTQAASGYGELHSALAAAADGTGQLASGAGALADGAGQFAKGIGELADGLRQVTDGAKTLYNGTRELADGINELYDGTQELESETRDLPDQIDEAVDGIMGDYDTSDFVPVSFMSERNTHVDAVQFVFQTREIAVVEVPAEVEEPEESGGFFSRLLDLFF